MFNLCIFLLFNITQKHKQNPKKKKKFLKFRLIIPPPVV